MTVATESPRNTMSNRRIAALVLSILLPFALVALCAIAVVEPEMAGSVPFWVAILSVLAGTSIAVVGLIATGSEDRMNGRLDELAGQFAALAEGVYQYGDDREASGVVTGIRVASGKADNVRQLRG